jgi:hypothetical protein
MFRRQFNTCTYVFDQLVHKGHDQLGCASSQVTPTGRNINSICCAHNLAVEHGAHPVLARHERRQRESDEEPHRAAEITDAMQYTAGEMIITRNAHPYRGPIKSHTVPINRRDRIEPANFIPSTSELV